MQAALKYIDRHDINKYNIHSVAISKVGAMAAGMMAGKRSPIKANDFLPFKPDAGNKKEGITDESLIVLQRLMRTQVMDGRVIALLAEEMKGFAGRNYDA